MSAQQRHTLGRTEATNFYVKESKLLVRIKICARAKSKWWYNILSLIMSAEENFFTLKWIDFIDE